jgi:hypothetical protein
MPVRELESDPVTLREARDIGLLSDSGQGDPRRDRGVRGDPPMDPPAVDRMAAFEQRSLPGEDMGVDGIDEGPVEVEDQGAHLASIGVAP